jgi:hypothetical protein
MAAIPQAKTKKPPDGREAMSQAKRLLRPDGLAT